MYYPALKYLVNISNYSCSHFVFAVLSQNPNCAPEFMMSFEGTMLHPGFDHLRV